MLHRFDAASGEFTGVIKSGYFWASFGRLSGVHLHEDVATGTGSELVVGC